jgi:hypothetical protein
MNPLRHLSLFPSGPWLAPASGNQRRQPVQVLLIRVRLPKRSNQIGNHHAWLTFSRPFMGEAFC